MQNHAVLKHGASVVRLTLIAESANRHRLRLLALIIIGTLPVIALSDAVPESPEAIVMRHLSAINSGDLDAAVAVYADLAIFINERENCDSQDAGGSLGNRPRAPGGASNPN